MATWRTDFLPSPFSGLRSRIPAGQAEAIQFCIGAVVEDDLQAATCPAAAQGGGASARAIVSDASATEADATIIRWSHHLST